MAKAALAGMTVNLLSDGYVGRVIDEAMAQLAKDLSERGHDGKARKMVLTLSLVAEDHGRVDIDAQVALKLPAYRTPSTRAKMTRSGEIEFNPECSENPEQQTFNDAEVNG